MIQATPHLVGAVLDMLLLLATEGMSALVGVL